MSSPREQLFALELFGIKLGLEQIRALLGRLGHPEQAYRSFTVAGTNGKGSVTAMLERALRAAGYRTGRYISPHLVNLEERFAINGRDVSSDELERVIGLTLDAAMALPAPPTFFEATTAAALEIFRAAGVEVAILEVGLGGRLDATNAVQSTGVAITSIAFDHEQYLGTTLEAIAAEKAAVIKPGAVVVAAPNPPAVLDVIRARAGEVSATLFEADDAAVTDEAMRDGRMHVSVSTPRHEYLGLRLGLAGRHQVPNAVTAIRLLEELTKVGQVSVPPDAIRVGVEDVVWPARLERLRIDGIDVILDGAHNPAGATALASYLHDAFGQRLPMVVGIMRDKNARAMIQALAAAASVFHFTAAASPRAAEPRDLAAIAAEVAPEIRRLAHDQPLDAVKAAAADGTPVVVAGSLYLAGDVRSESA